MTFTATLFSYLLFWLAAPFLATHKKIRRGFKRRFGFYAPGDVPRGDGPTIWLHGASAGDVSALHPTVVALKELEPNAIIVISSITNSGYSTAKQLEADFDLITYQPYDIPGPVSRALRAIRPDAVVLEYTELWPQLIYGCQRQGVPIFLHNGRFSAASMGKYKLLFGVVGNLLRPLRRLLLRDDYEAERARQLGATDSQVLVTGNTKFDNIGHNVDHYKVDELRCAFLIEPTDLVWVAGSTHEGEEDLLLRVFRRLRIEFPQLRMIIAPRYAHKADRIAQLAKKEGLTHHRRSSKSPGRCAVSILDTVGELAACYGLGTVVFVGGSFVTRGGQNILEPASWGRPVLFGPYMMNFPDAVQVLLGRGGLQVASEMQLEAVLLKLLREPEYREELGELAYERVLSVRGAAARNAAEIMDGIKDSRG